ncbi:MAG: sortase B protein-sorting domain-containing protein [Candidatus Saccharibacteria bacterium]|nr:sortase B protein-sorting domain-containing protein [Candidatus Saccharibacteria bacterium]
MRKLVKCVVAVAVIGIVLMSAGVASAAMFTDSNNATEEVVFKNPQTGDNAMIFLIAGIVSVAGLVGAGGFLKEDEK